MRRMYSGRVRRASGTAFDQDNAATTRRVIAAAGEAGHVVYRRVVDRLADRLRDQAIERDLARCVEAIVAGEAAALRPMPPDGSLAGGIAMRQRARAIAGFAPSAETSIASWGDELAAVLQYVAVEVPAPPTGDVIMVSVSLISLVKDAGRLMDRIVGAVLQWHSDEVVSCRPGSRLAETVKRNLLAASGLDEDEARRRPARLVWPSAAKATGIEAVEMYFGGTPLAELLAAKVAWGIRNEDLFESMWLVARIGHGKTQTLEWLISKLLERPSKIGLVVIDSQGELLRRLARLKLFAPGGRLADRLVYIDPREMQRPISLNPFALRRDRLEQYGPAMREQLVNGSVELLEYLFGAVLGAELTQKQGVVFRFLAQLMLSIEGSTLVTLREVLDEPQRFAREMAALEGSAQAFFAQHFMARGFAATREQIQRRLWGVLENGALARMLSTPDNKLDMLEALQAGKIILVDTAKDHLKDEKSAILGRVFVAMTLQAIYERAALPEAARTPALLVIDEAHEVGGEDEKAERFLLQARKYRAGLVLSHQHPHQLSSIVRRSLQSSAGVRLIGGVSDEDARELARDMKVSPEMLLGIERKPNATEFALHVRNRTRSAVKIEVPLGALDRLPKMTDREWREVMERNRARYGSSVIVETGGEPPVEDDAGDDWRS